MRKRVGTGVLLALLVTVAAGCAKIPDVTETNPQHQSGTGLNETPVTLHVYNTLGETVSMERAEEYIRRTMPNVTIESTYEIAPKMENAQLAAVRGGGGPEILYTQDYYTYVQNGYLKDLTSEPFLKNYMISALSDAEVGGKVYALPVGNGYISGLMVNQRLLTELGYELPQTQDEFVELCGRLQESREETGVRAYAFGMLYDERAALGAMPFFLDAYTDSAYVQWLSQYRRDPSSVSFQDPAFVRVLQELEELKALGLCQSSDFLTSDSQNLQEVIRGDALMCSVSYVDFAVRFEDKLTEVNGVPSFRVAKDGRQIYVPAEDFVFIPYMGKTRGESWLATNGDWYLGINANVADEATLQASRLYLEYVASTEFAPEYYSASVPAGATTYYRRDDTLEYSFFQERHPEVYQCLTENSIIKNPYQFYGSSLFTFSLRHYLCDQKYYAGLSGGSAYKDIGTAEDI
ncbi:ABC transporter substrate-binding protein, partial [Enterocloster asparagiformis]